MHRQGLVHMHGLYISRSGTIPILTPAANRRSIPKFAVFDFRLMEGHLFVDSVTKGYRVRCRSQRFIQTQLLVKFQISVDGDCEDIHPSVIGPACKPAPALSRSCVQIHKEFHRPNNKTMEVDVHFKCNNNNIQCSLRPCT